MNDLKQLIHEASMHYASETSNSVDEFVVSFTFNSHHRLPYF